MREFDRLYKRDLTPSVKAEATAHLREHEYSVLYKLWSKHQQRCRYWEVLNNLGDRRGKSLRISRPERRVYLAVVQRLINEGKLFRNCRTGMLHLTPSGEERLREIAGVKPKG